MIHTATPNIKLIAFEVADHGFSKDYTHLYFMQDYRAKALQSLREDFDDEDKKFFDMYIQLLKWQDPRQDAGKRWLSLQQENKEHCMGEWTIARANLENMVNKIRDGYRNLKAASRTWKYEKDVRRWHMLFDNGMKVVEGGWRQISDNNLWPQPKESTVGCSLRVTRVYFA